MTTIPLERFRDLSDIPEQGYETDIAPGPEELKRLAEWSGVDEVSRLHGHIKVRPQSRTTYLLETEFDADIVQSCVVTLEPVKSRIARSFARTLHFTPGLNRYADKGGLVTSESVDEDAPDEIDSLRYDLAGPLREEFALAIDPYPRAPGVEFESPEDSGDREEGPFAVLEKFRSSH
ncbi:MAG TPA: YceD family protein [Rhizomicrobium sp.]|nr:YceD family protein [Rhizomicrobium sp.]